MLLVLGYTYWFGGGNEVACDFVEHGQASMFTSNDLCDLADLAVLTFQRGTTHFLHVHSGTRKTTAH